MRLRISHTLLSLVGWLPSSVRSHQWAARIGHPAQASATERHDCVGRGASTTYHTATGMEDSHRAGALPSAADIRARMLRTVGTITESIGIASRDGSDVRSSNDCIEMAPGTSRSEGRRSLHLHYSEAHARIDKRGRSAARVT